MSDSMKLKAARDNVTTHRRLHHLTNISSENTIYTQGKETNTLCNSGLWYIISVFDNPNTISTLQDAEDKTLGLFIPHTLEMKTEKAHGVTKVSTNFRIVLAYRVQNMSLTHYWYERSNYLRNCHHYRAIIFQFPLRYIN